MRTTKTTQATREQIEKANNAWTMAKAARVTGHGGRRPGAGRPRIGPEVKLDLPAALIASYDALAERRGTTRAAAMREALTAWLAMEQAADRLGA